jgi:UDP-N-acetylglucosamine 2-epimerase
MKTILKVSKFMNVLFIQHPVTFNRLCKSGFSRILKSSPSIRIDSILGYKDFLEKIASCEFLITDGGSIQEESFYFDKPCLVMRKRTERIEGIGENVYLAKFDKNRIDYFLKNYKNFRRKSQLVRESIASQILMVLA